MRLILFFLILSLDGKGLMLIKDSLVKQRIFLSLNMRGIGEDNVLTGRRYGYFVVVSEGGIWLGQKLISGIQLTGSKFVNNFGYSKGYTPFEANVFLKYLPFNSPFRWLGFQGQVGISNSCMDIYDVKEPIFVKYAAGPFLHFTGKKRQWAFNYVLLFYERICKSCQGNFSIGREWISVWVYMGVNYTLKVRRHSTNPSP